MTVNVCFQSAPPIVPTGNNLQALIDATPNGQTLEIGSQQFVNPQPVIVNRGVSIHGNPDAVVGIVPSALRNWQTLIIRGAGTTLQGFQVVGNAPNNTSYKVLLEAQHAVEIQGADDVHLYNMFFHNTYGDAVAFQKDSGGNGNNRSRIIDCFADEIGRCLFTPIATNDTTVRRFSAGTPSNPNKNPNRINQSIVDIEPPSSTGWQCQDLLWTDCDYRIGQPTNILSRLGQGRNGDIANIILDSIRAHGMIFAVTAGPPDAAHGGPVRDGAFIFQSCQSSANYVGATAPIRMWRTDGVEFHAHAQTSSSAEGVYEMNDSTGPGGGAPLIDNVLIHQRCDATGEWYAYDDGTYWTWSD